MKYGQDVILQKRTDGNIQFKMILLINLDIQ